MEPARNLYFEKIATFAFVSVFLFYLIFYSAFLELPQSMYQPKDKLVEIF